MVQTSGPKKTNYVLTGLKFYKSQNNNDLNFETNFGWILNLRFLADFNWELLVSANQLQFKANSWSISLIS